MLGICRFHVYGNGWNDIGYNALVDRYGTLYEAAAGGLKKPIVGAQAQGFNSVTTSIASIGDYTTELITPGGHPLDHSLPRLEDGGNPRISRPGLSRDWHGPADFSRRLPEPVPGRGGGHGAADRRPSDSRPHHLPGDDRPPDPAIRTAVQKRIKRYLKPWKKKGKKKRAAAGRAASASPHG